MTEPSYKSFLGEPVCNHPGCPCNTVTLPPERIDFAEGARVARGDEVGQVVFITASLAERGVVRFRPDDGPFDYIVSMDELEAE